MGSEASDQFNVAVTHEGGRAVLELAGEFDLYGAERFNEHLAALGSATDLEIRVSGVTFIDSGGLQALLTAQRDAQERGTEFRISAMSKQVARVAEVAGVADLLTVDP